jgi:hypothetical protein
MNRLRDHLVGLAAVGFSLLVTCHDLRAQSAAAASAASSAASTATSTGMGTGTGMGMGGMGLMPMMSAMNPTASLSPTDAAALGMQGQNNGAMGVNGMNGLFMNPMAAPYLFGVPMSNSQIGGMMLMNQMNGGIGSGQLSGVRPGPAQMKGRSKKAADKPRGTASTPAGLAARYFNRTVSVNRPVNVSRIPQNYYTRQNRYYPQVAR